MGLYSCRNALNRENVGGKRGGTSKTQFCWLSKNQERHSSLPEDRNNQPHHSNYLESHSSHPEHHSNHLAWSHSNHVQHASNHSDNFSNRPYNTLATTHSSIVAYQPLHPKRPLIPDNPGPKATTRQVHTCQVTMNTEHYHQRTFDLTKHLICLQTYLHLLDQINIGTQLRKNY